MPNQVHNTNNFHVKSGGYLGGSHVNFNGGVHRSNIISTVGLQQNHINNVSRHYDNDNYHHKHHHNHMYYNYYGGNNYYPLYYYNEIPYILDADVLNNKYELLDNKCYDIVKKKEIVLEKGTTKECENWCNSINEDNNLVFSNVVPSSNNKCQCFIKTGKKMCP